jgi:hypothetical protein
MSKGSESQTETGPNQRKDTQQTETWAGGNRTTNLEGWNALIANAKQYNRPTHSGIN